MRRLGPATMRRHPVRRNGRRRFMNAGDQAEYKQRPGGTIEAAAAKIAGECLGSGCRSDTACGDQSKGQRADDQSYPRRPFVHRRQIMLRASSVLENHHRGPPAIDAVHVGSFVREAERKEM